jgi:predicted RNA binding protein YcfA (HicA-like mRNA interferase family)
VSRIESLIEKLLRETASLRELGVILHHFGFAKMRGKGSHVVWGHADYQDIHIVIATHTKEVPRYQLRQIIKSMKNRGLL